MLQNVSRPEPSPRERVQRILVLLGRSKAYWRSSLGVILMVSSACLAVVWRLPHIYMSEALILAQPAIRTDTREAVPSIDAARIGAKLKDRLLSRSRLARIIDELKLFPDTVEKRGMQDAVEEMRLHVGFRARDSDTFLVSFEASDPRLAQQVAERLADSLIDDFVTEGLRRAVASRDFLIDEERRAADELDRRGRELSAFIAQHPEFAYDPNRLQGVPNEGARVSPLLGPGTAAQSVPNAVSSLARPPSLGRVANDPELIMLQREKNQVEAELAAAAGGEAADGADHKPPKLREERDKLVKELALAQADLADKRRRYTDEHPDLISARNHAVELSRALSAVEQQARQAGPPRTSGPTGSKAAELQRRLLELKGSISTRERSLSAAFPGTNASPGVPAQRPLAGGATLKIDNYVALEADWQRLVQAAAEARRAKDDVSDRRSRAELVASAAQSSGSMVMTIVDQAFLPLHPIKPNRRLIAGVCFSCAMILGLLWALSGVLLSDVVHDAADLEANGGSPVLALLPKPAEDETVVGVTPSELTRRRKASAPRRSENHEETLPNSAVIVPEPSEHGAPTLRELPAASVSAEQTEVDMLGATTREGGEQPGGIISAHPICDVDDGHVIAARVALSTWGRHALSRRTRGWPSVEPSLRSDSVRIHDWTRDLEDREPRPNLNGEFESWEIPLSGSPDLALQAAALIAPNALSALRLLRHWVEQQAHDRGMVVGITSPTRGEGKTRLAIQLAWMLSESQRSSVLLLEANFERPRIGEMLGLSIPRGCGFSAQIQRRIAGGSRLGWGVVSIDPTLHVLAESTSDARVPATLHSREFAQAIEELRVRYDYIIIDGPSIIDGGNATSVESTADGLLMVVRAGLSKGSTIRRAGRALGTRRLLGFILTDVEEHAT